MARKLKWDFWLLITTLALVAVSIVMVFSASKVLATEKYGQPNLFLWKQAMFAAVGVGVMLIAMHVPYERYRDARVYLSLLAAAGAGLVAVLIIGPEINGTKRWFGIAGIGVQPSEVAKFSLVLFVAALLSRRMDRIREPKALVPVAAALLGAVALILAEPDFGTSVTLIAIVGLMVFAAGLPVKHLAIAAAPLIPAIIFAAIWAPYRLRRLLAFLHPWDDRFGDGFQIVQSLIAVGTGGVAGRGLGYGVQKLFYLPYPHTDFIFAVVGEELGLIGASLMVACFAIIAWRGLRTALRAPDAFGALLALGLTAMIAMQAFVNISVVLGMLPTKGLTLPFMSAGGSSLIISLAGMGVLLNISWRASATT
jgi:cell division protein FtsW